MPNRGISFGSAVALGVCLANTVIPLEPTAAAGGVVMSCLATIGTARVWWLVPASLAAWRATTVRRESDARTPQGPMLSRGWISVVGESGRGRIVQVGLRRALVADSTRALPPPGHDAEVLLRLDPIRSRADRSSFRAGRWARARRFDARGRCVGSVSAVRPTAGAIGHVRRATAWVRDRARRRLGYGETPARSLVTALVIGDRTALEDEALESFRHAGLAHVLALSGMHVGVLALGFGGLLRAVRVPAPGVMVATLLFLSAFAVMTGGAAPILRACGTGGLALLAGALHRRSPPGHGLGLIAGALLLMHPPLLFDPGFRLSFLAAGALATYSAHAPRPTLGWRGWPRALGEGLMMSACVTVATAPEIVSSFGAVSLLSPITNLLAGIPATLALGWGALGAWIPAAGPLAQAAALSAQLLMGIAGSAGGIPGGNLMLPAPGPAAAAWVLAATLVAATRRTPAGPLRHGLIAGLLLAVGAALPRDRVTFVDIGQGDAVLLERGGHAVLVDTGPPDWGGREPPGLAALRTRRWRPLDALVLTHGHADHTGAAREVLTDGRCRQLVVRGIEPNAQLNDLKALAEDGDHSVVLAARLPGVPGIRVTSPWAGIPPADVSENDRSLVTRWTSGARTVLTMGDGGHRSEAAWLANVAPDSARATVLLVPHHGSRGSAGAPLLDAVRPALAVISCGDRNPHGHPHSETLERLRHAGAAILRTDRDGTITLTASPGGFRIRWERAFPGARTLLPSFPLLRGGPLP